MFARNSERVVWLALKTPSIALVTILAFAFFTPRIAAHM
jgi:hypothetical protein